MKRTHHHHSHCHHSKMGQVDQSFTDGTHKGIIPIIDTIQINFYNLKVRTDRKIVVGISVADSSTSPTLKSYVYLFHPDGSLDKKFGTDGVVTLKSDTGFRMSAFDICGDEILVYGQRWTNLTTDFPVLKIDGKGHLDESFAEVIVPNAYNEVPVQIVWGGCCKSFYLIYTKPGPKLVVDKYFANGHLDPDFGISGSLIVQNPKNAGQYLRQVASPPFAEPVIDRKGNLVIIGEGTYSGLSVYMVKISPQGHFVTKFGNEGFLNLYPVLYDSIYHVSSMIVGPDNSILVNSDNAYPYEKVLIKIDEDGRLDRDFVGDKEDPVAIPGAIYRLVSGLQFLGSLSFGCSGDLYECYTTNTYLSDSGVNVSYLYIEERDYKTGKLSKTFKYKSDPVTQPNFFTEYLPLAVQDKCGLLFGYVVNSPTPKAYMGRLYR